MLSERIKASVTVMEFVSQYVDLKPTASGAVGLCPFHRETKPSFTVDPSAGLWYCFGCARGGDVISFVMELADVGFIEACKILSNGRLPELPRRLPKD